MKGPVYRYFQYLIAIVIAWFEGYFQPGSRARRNNNPGNLKGWWSALPQDSQGFDVFPNAMTGWDALFRQVEKNIDRRLSPEEFIKGRPLVYPGYSRTDQDAYVDFIVEKTGLLGNVPIINQINRIQRQFV